MPYAIEYFGFDETEAILQALIDATPFVAVAGEALIVIVSHKHATALQTTTLSDLDGTNPVWDEHTNFSAVAIDGATYGSRVFSLLNCAAGSCSIRATFGANVDNPWLVLIRVSGLAGAYDKSAHNYQNGPGIGTDAVTSGSTAALTSAPQLALGISFGLGSFTGAPSAGTGYTDIGAGAGFDGIATARLEHKRVTTAAAVAATFTAVFDGEFFTSVITFLESAAVAVMGRRVYTMP